MGLFAPVRVAHAHCDLFCGVYDPAQAKIEAMSVLKITEKYQASDDPVFRDRALALKEERAELVKHHLMVLWADFFGPEHVAAFPQLHDLFWRAIRQAGVAKKTVDPEDGRRLLELIDEIAEIFWQTDKAKAMGVYPPS
ncbi:superoxide dismutase [Ni] precursor [bacterium BMS3Abin02]|nr:superoxide dismutase [Ni] precursor [bacterium BMS3Abin02]GBE23500.1 superoxide dismutase [Ni] precursor [bacterium BMS3Bbin01]HDH27147.1 superoxide dismutase, Ni [Actinomycetota bacterium]HDK45854.1 superoxide dismutase, Ni [Actinomycetota bacterium]HDL49723.1 superoxide dismutase, Ni [Actinomycetota bacterium]